MRLISLSLACVSYNFYIFAEMAIRLTTFNSWVKQLDINHVWLDYVTGDELNEFQDSSVKVIFCKMCRKYEDKIRCLRNFSRAFIDGSSGTALKKDNIVKHSKSDMHIKAMNLEKNSAQTLNDIYKTTPIGKAFTAVSILEKERVGKLFDIAYALAKEELPFSKFPTFVNLEIKHKVNLGQSYLTEKKCSEFTTYIGEDMEQELIEALNKTEYFSILMDGSTDVSIQEKELIFILFIDDNGQVRNSILRLKAVNNSTAEGLKEALYETFTEMGILDAKFKIIGLGTDGAAVNLGKKKGLCSLLRADSEWLVSVHCLNHRLELAIKDAFSHTYIDEVSSMLMNLYYLYTNSPKRLRELKAIAEIMEETVQKPLKAHGTRWIQYKYRACKILIQSYSVIITHLENMASDEKTADQAKMKGYLNKLKTVIFVANMLFFRDILEPLAQLSLSLQGYAADLLYAMTSLDTLYAKFSTMKNDDMLSYSEEVNYILNSDGTVVFKGVNLIDTKHKLSHQYFSSYIVKIEKCFQNRFNDLKNGSVLQPLKLLDVTVWPQHEADLINFANEELTLFINHFSSLLSKHKVDIMSLKNEWCDFKLFWLKNLTHLTRGELWGKMCSSLKEKFPNFRHVVNILQIFPMSNANVERGFSIMGRVKTDWRNRLNDKTVEYLMRIKLEGPNVVEYNSNKVVEKFFNERPRRPIMDSGPSDDHKAKKQKLDHV